jgi:hypothetical protein
MLKRPESGVFSQLRTGMARVNSYLHKIGAVELNMCDCRQEEETIVHFLFRCPKRDVQRECRRQVDQTKMGEVSFFLGGKTASGGQKWAPNLQAVRAAIKFAISIGRLAAN